jgi:hypothetical protein
MSNRYKGGVISATPPTTTGGDTGTASGAWTLEQQMQAQAAGLWPSPPPIPYIEDVFSTWLYTGQGAGVPQTITNGINLSGKGGLVWLKNRDVGYNHNLFDTVRGVNKRIFSNSTSSESNTAESLTAFNNNGFTIGTVDAGFSGSGEKIVSWTFREQQKFFDVVTYTGTGVARTVAHNLDSVPGCIIVKRTDTTGAWAVYHRSVIDTNFKILTLNNTDSVQSPGDEFWSVSNITSTTFGVGTASRTNAFGGTYVAYLFAHNAGGFGATETDNVISCGSYTGTGTAGLAVTLNYEPQWLMVKNAGSTGNWEMMDTMRGMSLTSGVNLIANGADAESNTGPQLYPTATGFVVNSTSSALNTNAVSYIYIAIRRGPMKTPTSGTSVFDAGTRAGSSSNAKTNSDILTDLSIIKRYTAAGEYWAWANRLVGNLTLKSNSDAAENSGAMATSAWDTMTGAFAAASNGATNTSTLIDYSFQRAPGYHDVVCYTGNGVNGQTYAHNLAVVPELMIVKRRNDVREWNVYAAPLGATKFMFLNTQDAVQTDTMWNNTAPTSSVFSVGDFPGINASGSTYVNYLFATVAGVSKVGSYTGTGTTQTINCGFTGGSRFVMIKRTDSTGAWYVWDSARGIIPSNDPYLLLNSTAAEVTGTDYVDTTSVGFEISSTAPAAINANGGTFVFLAIA